MKEERRNQLHVPRHRNQENDRDTEKVKMYYKDGNSTILFTDKLTYLESICLAANINRYCERKNVKLVGTFIYTGKKHKRK